MAHSHNNKLSDKAREQNASDDALLKAIADSKGPLTNYIKPNFNIHRQRLMLNPVFYANPKMNADLAVDIIQPLLEMQLEKVKAKEKAELVIKYKNKNIDPDSINPRNPPSMKLAILRHSGLAPLPIAGQPDPLAWGPDTYHIFTLTTYKASPREPKDPDDRDFNLSVRSLNHQRFLVGDDGVFEATVKHGVKALGNPDQLEKGKKVADTIKEFIAMQIKPKESFSSYAVVSPDFVNSLPDSIDRPIYDSQVEIKGMTFGLMESKKYSEYDLIYSNKIAAAALDHKAAPNAKKSGQFAAAPSAADNAAVGALGMFGQQAQAAKNPGQHPQAENPDLPPPPPPKEQPPTP